MNDTQYQLEINALFENLTPMQHKRVAVLIGRFSPPQAGHYKLIQDVVKWVKTHAELKLQALPVVIIIGGSKSDSDLKKNPLSIADRELFMKASGKAPGVTFLTASNAFSALEAVRNAGFEPIAIAAGTDRMDGYIQMLDKYYLTPDEQPIKHYKIELSRSDAAVDTDKVAKRESMMSIIKKMQDGTDPKIDEISASLARLAVEMNAKEEFAKIVGLEHNTTLANKMFMKIKTALDTPVAEPVSKVKKPKKEE